MFLRQMCKHNFEANSTKGGAEMFMFLTFTKTITMAIMCNFETNTTKCRAEMFMFLTFTKTIMITITITRAIMHNF